MAGQIRFKVRVLLFAWLAAGLIGQTTARAAEEEFVVIKGHRAHPTRLLAKYKPGMVANRLVPAAAGNLVVAHEIKLVPGLVVLDEPKPAGRVAAAVQPAFDPKAKAALLANRISLLKDSGQFEYVEPDYLVYLDATPTDAAFADGRLWGLRNTGQSGGVAGADIGAVQAWNITTGSPDVIVAVIDSGIRYTHRDLAPNMWRNPGEIPGNGIDDDGDGYVDNVFGINAITDSGDPMDDNGHGTHVAGTIGAVANDSNGHVGVSWNVKLMACKFLPGVGTGKTFDAIKCIEFAVSKGARVLNNSWGGGSSSQALFDAIARARDRGVLFVAAAGNDGTDNDQIPHYPSNYNLDNIISVAALDRRDVLAGFSCFGRNTVHVGAPGVEIFSCWVGSDSDYKSIPGTSMATPHVAGVAALILSHYHGMSVSELRRAILSTGVPVPALQGKTTSGTRVNAFNALSSLADGNLEISVRPVPGSTLIGGALTPIGVSISDGVGVSNATVTATIVGSTNLVFNNTGTPPDTAQDANYSAALSVPPFTNSVGIALSVSAPGKTTTNFTVQYAIAVPPANNDFEKRSGLNGTNLTVSGSTQNANKQAGEPSHAGNAGGRSVWWTWTAPVNGRLQVSTTGSAFDTLLAVYTGSAVNALTLAAQNNNSTASGVNSLVAFNVTAGTIYQIALDGFAGARGDYQLQLQFTAGNSIPGNDLFSSAVTLSGSDTSGSGNSANAAKEAGEPAHAGNAGGASVWFNWTAPTSGTVTLTTTGSSFDTLLAVYTGGAVGSLAELASNDDDASGGIASRVQFPATSGQTYRFAVDGYNGASGSFSLQLALTAAPAAPVNDFIQNGIVLSGTSTSGTGSNVGATKAASEPNHAGNSGGSSVWWIWTAPSSGVTTITTAGSGFDTLLAVYTGTAISALTSIASNDDSASGGSTSQVIFNAVSGTTYRIAVDGYRDFFDAAESGTISLSLTLDTGIRPANDNFADRIVLSGTSLTNTGSSIGATRESTSEPLHAGNIGGRSVWWTWTAPFSGYVEVSTAGSSFDTLLAVYTGPLVTALTAKASNDDDSNGGNTSRLVFNAVAGASYQIAVDGYNGASGNITLNLKALSTLGTAFSTSLSSSAGYSTALPLAGQNGWLGSGPGQNGVVTNFFAGLGQQGYVGFAPTTAGNTGGSVWRPVTISSNENRIVRFTVLMKVVDSTNGEFDSFRWSIYNTNGTRLFSLVFDNSDLSISTLSQSGPALVPTGRSFNNTSIHQLEILMSFAQNAWSALLDGVQIVSSQPMANAGTALDFGSARAVWLVRDSAAPGNNRMVFDDYRLEVITELNPPEFTTQPQSQMVTAGSTVNLTTSGTGTGPLFLQWYRDGTNIAGATNGTLSLSNVQTNQAGRYWVAVTNLAGSATSQEAILLVRPTVSLPVNDSFANRISINGISNVVFGATVNATKEAGEPNHAGNTGGKSVWWSWTAPASGQFILSTAGSDFDTLLVIYTGSVVSSLSSIAASDDAQSQTRSAALVLTATAGTTYQIAVDGYNGDAGNVRLVLRPAVPLAFAHPTKPAGGAFQATFAGEPGIRFLIQVSTNFSSWSTVATVVGQDGVLNYLDTQATNAPARFYRAVREP